MARGLALACEGRKRSVEAHHRLEIGGVPVKLVGASQDRGAAPKLVRGAATSPAYRLPVGHDAADC